MVTTDIDQVKLWLNQWDDVQKSRKIYRLLHDAFLSNEQRESASEMMIELLRTYPEESAGEAKDDATNCIVSFIDRPNVWIMDHLLELGPVRSLKEELIYQILEIFVSGSIKDYIKFYEENSNFVESTGLNHERNLRKIRILTFISLVNKHDEITFEELSKELNINVENVESFIIDVLKTRLARVRIDEVDGRIITSSAAYRTFGNKQWQILQQRLKEWQTNLQTVQKQLIDIQPNM
ncbi:eukaryotic translation initiation factor 3 subunit M-like [Paramuricea clavata]|uniref:Eukaryotic translation initiation factor 3 subunit M-like n=1 Tax=Paramuricea clavata TaxID=317549 RepID=A0A7D9ENL7_PARCT|nr:eukaryotic translation initiation factor 3 subunit M-like [Paramuricea clavata]